MLNGGLPMLSSARAERAHVGDLARHQKLKRILGAGVPAEIDQALVDDLRARFGRDIAAKVDVQFAGDLEIIAVQALPMELNRLTPPPPAIAISGSTSASSRTDFSGLRCIRAKFRRFPDGSIPRCRYPSAGPSARIVAVQALDGILHRSGEFAVGAAKLLEQHVAERGSGSSTRTVYISFLTW